ncbi:hypothetical protein [Tabrizicola sp.]|uniref:hypothetical protein n=1 Tax=Tabrizicola sp. TaxID=2005166 RepID=UPI003F2B7554
MSEAFTLNLWNSILPLVLLCGLVVLLPGWFSGKGNESHRALGWAAFKTAVVTYAVGAVVMAGLYAAINEGAYEQFVRDPVERANFFLSRSALFAMLWGPLLGFVWLVKAQELNRRIGLKMTDGERGKV